MKAVFDTNILVSATLWRGSPYRCFLAVQAGLVELFVSPPILSEFTRVLQDKFHLPAGQVAEALAVVAGAVSLVEISGTLRVVLNDPEDDKFIETAQTARADYLVTGDHHLLKLGLQGSPRIVNARAFLDMLSQPRQ